MRSRPARTLLRLRLVLLGVGLFLCAVLLLVGLWPFEFFPENEMAWVGDAEGLRVGPSGIAWTRDEITLLGAEHDEFTVEMVIKPTGTPRRHIGRIVSIMGSDRTERFFVGQQGDGLMAHFYGTPFDDTFAPAIPDLRFRGEQLFHVVLSYRRGEVSFFLNGTPIAHRTLSPLRSLSGILIVGNSPNGDKGWTGEIAALRFSPESTSAVDAASCFRVWRESGSMCGGTDPGQTIVQYAFAERSGRLARSTQGSGHDLVVPKRLEKKNLQLLHLPFDEIRLSKSYIFDVVLNSLGFIPFGFCAALFLLSFDRLSYSRLLLWTTATGCLISLVIEVLQAFTTSRSSQLSDVILNTLGSLAGAVLCLLPLLLDACRQQPAAGNPRPGAGL